MEYYQKDENTHMNLYLEEKVGTAMEKKTPRKRYCGKNLKYRVRYEYYGGIFFLYKMYAKRDVKLLGFFVVVK